MIATEADARNFCAGRVSPEAFLRLERFIELLRSENANQNLVARSSLESIWQRHIADSLQLLDYVPRETGFWLDLGSGGGLPGLVIAIASPKRSVVLVESRKLRVAWLNTAAERLGLSNVEIVGTRLEAYPTRAATVISARAFAPLTRLLQLAGRFSTPSTAWVLPKGRSAVQELADQSPAVRRMFHVEQSLTDPEAGILVGRGVPGSQ